MLSVFWVDFLAIAAAVFFQIPYDQEKVTKYKDDDDEKPRLTSILYSVTWFSLYILITFAIHQFVEHTVLATDGIYNNFDITLYLICFNLLLNKLWMPLFFGGFGPWGRGLALIVNILMLATGVTVFAYFIMQSMWVSTGCWAVYVAFNTFAIFLNVKALAWFGDDGELKIY